MPACFQCIEKTAWLGFGLRLPGGLVPLGGDSQASFLSLELLSLGAYACLHTPRMHFANRANDTLQLFKAGFEEHKPCFMGKPAGPSPFQSSVCLGRPRHPPSPRGGVEAGRQHGCWKGEKRKGRVKGVRQCQRDRFQGWATMLGKWLLEGVPVWIACGFLGL